MKKSTPLLLVVLFFSATLSATELIPNSHAVQVTNNSLELHLFAPTTASPGQTISIVLWTIFENVTSDRSDLAFNNTSPLVANTTMSFVPKTNLGPVSPHIHTVDGAFVTLPPLKQWVHPGAWSTSYTVPSLTGLYGVHIYANYTVIPVRGAPTSYIAQAETTFSVQASAATASDVSGLASANTGYAVLGLVAVAVVLDLLLLFWKRSPVKP